MFLLYSGRNCRLSGEPDSLSADPATRVREIWQGGR